MTIFPEPGSLAEIVGRSLNQMQPLFRQKQQRVSVRLPENLPGVPMDREKINKVITNLLSNAHKFSPSGG